MSDSKTEQDFIDTILHKLGIGDQISKELVQEAKKQYLSIVLQLKSYKCISEFDESGGKHEKSDYEKLKRELDQLRADHSANGKELEYYRRIAKQQSNENPNIIHQTNINTYSAEFEKLRKELDTQNAKHRSAMEDLKQELNMEKENHRKAIQNHELGIKQEKEHTSRIPELEQEIAKAKANLNEAMKKLKDELTTEKKNLSKAREELERYKNRDNTVNKKDEVLQGQDQEHPRAMEKLREQNKKLREENDRSLEQIKELRNRLSIMAGHKLTADNPAIADLSDSNRPTRLAEQFKELYDEEWTRAYEEIGEKVSNNDEDIIEILAMILKDIDHFCGRAGTQQFHRLVQYAKLTMLEPDYHPDGKESQPIKSERSGEMSKDQEDLAVKLLKDFRKSLGILSKNPLVKIFRNLSMSHFKWKTIQIKPSKDLMDFIDKSLELVWMMKIQNPPMEFVWSKSGDKYNKNMCTFYTKRGETVTQCVWPAVVLHTDGPLMSKGIVQGK